MCIWKVQTDRSRLQDKLIVSTAIPQITNEFNSAGDIGWYGTAFLLTNCAFQLVFGKLYKIFSIKATFLTSILLFEAGSALCGAAPNSIAFILGRSIAGLGAGGVLSGVVCFVSLFAKDHPSTNFFLPPVCALFLINPLTQWYLRLPSLPTLSRWTSAPNTRVSSVPCLASLRCSVL